MRDDKEARRTAYMNEYVTLMVDIEELLSELSFTKTDVAKTLCNKMDRLCVVVHELECVTTLMREETL